MLAFFSNFLLLAAIIGLNKQKYKRGNDMRVRQNHRNMSFRHIQKAGFIRQSRKKSAGFKRVIAGLVCTMFVAGCGTLEEANTASTNLQKINPLDNIGVVFKSTGQGFSYAYNGCYFMEKDGFLEAPGLGGDSSGAGSLIPGWIIGLPVGTAIGFAEGVVNWGRAEFRQLEGVNSKYIGPYTQFKLDQERADREASLTRSN